MNPYDTFKQVFTERVATGEEWSVTIDQDHWAILFFHDHYRVEKNHDCLATPDTAEQAIYFFLSQIGTWG